VDVFNSSASDRSQSDDVAVASQLQAMLQTCEPRLRSYIERHMPQELRRTVEVSDVLQDTFFEAFRRAGEFVPTGEDAAHRWLVTIARHRILNLLRSRRASKREGSRVHLEGDGDVMKLMGELLVYSRTPSRSAMSHELALEVQRSIDRLNPDYCQIIRMRYIEGLSVEETVAKVGRSAAAVMMLCHRAVKALRVEMQKIPPELISNL
jgi:RNA polymerase sigma-70 factor, ECF subfamily